MVSRFGTSKEMVLQTIEENSAPCLLAIDQRGLYLTNDKYIDRNIADPNRSSNRASMEKRISALGIDCKAMFEENKHLIPKMPKEVAVKVNPLKASKRAAKGR